MGIDIVHRTATRIAIRLHGLASRALRRLLPDTHARRWSNAELRKFAPLFHGSVINVSGWNDGDKEGGHYRNYFRNAAAYTVSNIQGARGLTGADGELLLDLTQEAPPALERAFDVVFNHTTLEHIYAVHTAMKNLCLLSKDAVILVVPFMQPVRCDPTSYLDYWRFTPHALRQMFGENGFEVLYCSHNAQPVGNVYVFVVATRNVDRWRDVLAPFSLEQGGSLPTAEAVSFKEGA